MLEALRLQWEWGADEALQEAPQDRRIAFVITEAPILHLGEYRMIFRGMVEKSRYQSVF